VWWWGGRERRKKACAHPRVLARPPVSSVGCVRRGAARLRTTREHWAGARALRRPASLPDGWPGHRPCPGRACGGWSRPTRWRGAVPIGCVCAAVGRKAGSAHGQRGTRREAERQHGWRPAPAPRAQSRRRCGLSIDAPARAAGWGRHPLRRCHAHSKIGKACVRASPSAAPSLPSHHHHSSPPRPHQPLNRNPSSTRPCPAPPFRPPTPAPAPAASSREPSTCAAGAPHRPTRSPNARPSETRCAR
jgi:hypothetical protein